ncbi:glycosyltransferase family 2 protein [Halorhabdus salina]|uniref:glycosyltransferase family 2 protein n=1 Tax=Halorhabdus salina TaxID=2750670 RepID=UPI0015EEB3A7|nr:glycosyltransferase family 2 protein [Halorhabdus salina]
MVSLVSVVLPYYQGEAYVESALRSVDAQTHSEIEIVVIDDGSRTPATEVLEGVRDDLDVPLRVLRHDENRGISAARNTGVNAARGDYVTILDQDDAMHPEKIAAQVKRMEEEPSLGMTLTNVRHINADGVPIRIRDLRDGIDSESTEELVRELYRCWTTEAGPLPLTTELTRSEVYDEMGGYDTSLYGANDREFLFRVAAEYDVSVINSPLLDKRYHEKNASNASRKLLTDRLHLTDKVLNHHPWLEQYHDKRAAFLLLLMFRADLADGELGAAASSYLSALQLAPLFTLRRTIVFPVKILQQAT